MGRDKAWLELAGRPMIEHVIRALAPVTSAVAVLANSDEYKRLGLPVYRDINKGIGPLEAIRSALANSPTERILLAGCDIPFVTSELFAFLLDQAGNFEAVVTTDLEGRLEPLCACYRTGALDEVNRQIEQGEFKVSHLFDRVKTKYIAFDEIRYLPGSDLFFMNVNTAEDLARASRILSKSGL